MPALVLAVALLAAACSSSGASSAPGRTDTTDQAAGVSTNIAVDEGTPKDGGSLAWGLEAETDSLNPATGRWAISGHMVGSSIFDPLATLDDEGRVTPYLAESWDHNADFTTWTFHLTRRRVVPGRDPGRRRRGVEGAERPVVKWGIVVPDSARYRRHPALVVEGGRGSKIEDRHVPGDGPATMTAVSGCRSRPRGPTPATAARRRAFVDRESSRPHGLIGGVGPTGGQRRARGTAGPTASRATASTGRAPAGPARFGGGGDWGHASGVPVPSPGASVVRRGR